MLTDAVILRDAALRLAQRPERAVCGDWARRRGEFQLCGKLVVALRRDGDGNPYPVCVHHARVDAMVPLVDILAALTGDPNVNVHRRP